MSNWIDKYKTLTISSYKHHILVTDPDSLFSYAELGQAFEDEGYSILVCKTDLDVRVKFEIHVKDSRDKYLIVAPEDYAPLPDIEAFVAFKRIGLVDVFSNLDAKAIKGLSFNALCVLSNIKSYEKLGFDRTLQYLLENLYSVDFNALIQAKSKELILIVLITVFLEKNAVNPPLVAFLMQMSKSYFPELAHKELTKSSLMGFIQEQWRCYLDNKKALVDFTDSTLIKHMGYLFVNEYLMPVKVSNDQYDEIPKALKIGAYVDKEAQIDNELESLIELIKLQIEDIEDNPDQWFKIIQPLAKAKLKSFLTSNIGLIEDYHKLEIAINNRFQHFIDNTYNNLYSLSGVIKPVVVSKILDHIYAQTMQKKALLVIDGMNYWQWLMLSNHLSDAGINITASASLAYIPTITAWSRQAIFRGEKPQLSESNSKEASHFKAYWLGKGVLDYQIAFKSFSVNEPLSVDDISTDVTHLGLVCNDLDDIMHGAIMGNKQLLASSEQWIKTSGIASLIGQLKSKGFKIFITADHGNIEASGIGNLTLSDKVGAKSRGKRHLYFSNETLCDEFFNQNPKLVLGRKRLSIYLKNQEAFTTVNTQVITHGGSHFWEVIVPFISIYE